MVRDRSGDIYLQNEEEEDPFCRTRGLKDEFGRGLFYLGFFLY